jgi:hypothetical protein
MTKYYSSSHSTSGTSITDWAEYYSSLPDTTSTSNWFFMTVWQPPEPKSESKKKRVDKVLRKMGR